MSRGAHTQRRKREDAPECGASLPGPCGNGTHLIVLPGRAADLVRERLLAVRLDVGDDAAAIVDGAPEALDHARDLLLGEARHPEREQLVKRHPPFLRGPRCWGAAAGSTVTPALLFLLMCGREEARLFRFFCEGEILGVVPSPL